MPSATRDQIAPPPSSDYQQQRQGSGLDPAVVSAVIREADDGRLASYQDLLDELRETDGHLHSQLQAREQQVAGAPWELQPPERSGARGRRIAAWVSDVLKTIPEFNACLLHWMGAVYRGRAVVEVIWARDGRRLVPARMIPLHARRFSYTRYDWRLRLWDPSGDKPEFAWPGKPLDEFPAGKFIVHAPPIMGGYPTREGVGRAIIWPAVFKRWAWRDRMSASEIWGRGIRLATYKTGKDGGPQASKEDIDKAEELLDNFSGAASGVLADTIEPKLQMPTGTATLHQDIITDCNADISKAVNLGTLQSDAGTKGARSLGEVHRDQQLMLGRGDARELAQTLGQQLIRVMVERNFGRSAPVPELRFSPEPEEQLDSLAGRIEKLVTAGVVLKQAEVRDRFGYTDPEPGDAVIVPWSARQTFANSGPLGDVVHAKPGVRPELPETEPAEPAQPPAGAPSEPPPAQTKPGTVPEDAPAVEPDEGE